MTPLRRPISYRCGVAAMSDEMSFGEIQQTRPEQQLRPDQDARWAVVAVGNPHDEPVPIFVHFETWRAIERSVAEDTTIELGGVLLGEQCVDDRGQPFVQITDALEARHYEATKGSFKFTHDTWQDLLQRAANYPAGTKLVGWYHSHPGWGIFLSELDLFICQSFFTHPLDVALVVDPCQDQRGWFYWDASQAQPVKQRSQGFFLYDSRHRHPLLEQVADVLTAAEQPMNRSSTSRRSGTAALWGNGTDQVAGGVAPQVFVSQADHKWPMVFLAALVTLQAILISLVGWALLRPSPSTSASEAGVYQAVIKSLVDVSDPSGTPPVSQQRLEALLRDQQELRQLRTQNELLTAAGAATLRDVGDLSAQLETSGTELRRARALNRDLEARVASLERAREQSQSAIAADQDVAVSVFGSWLNGWPSWATHGLMGGLGLALGAAVVGWWLKHQANTEIPDDEKG